MREYPVGMAGTKRIQNFLDYLILKNVIINVISFRSMNQQPQKKGSFNSVPYLQVGQNTDMKLSHIHKVLLYYFNGLYYIAKFKKKKYSNIIYNSGGISIENFIFILWARLLGYKLILAIEEDYTFFKDDIKSISKFKFWTVKKLDFLNCRWADVILTLSIYLKNKYIKKKAKKVILIPISAKIDRKSTRLTPVTV